MVGQSGFYPPNLESKSGESSPIHFRAQVFPPLGSSLPSGFFLLCLFFYPPFSFFSLYSFPYALFLFPSTFSLLLFSLPSEKIWRKCSQKAVRMTSTDEVYGSMMRDGALTCYGTIAWRSRTKRGSELRGKQVQCVRARPGRHRLVGPPSLASPVIVSNTTQTKTSW